MNQRVVEFHYSASELSWLIGLQPKYWRQQMKAAPQLVDAAGHVLSECTVIGREFFAPASWVNAFLARHPVLTVRPGVQARTPGELRRKLVARQADALPVAA